MTDAPLAGTTVLVVEDDPLLRRQLAAFIERAGADVVAAADIAAARRALESMSFDLALTDVNLPDGLGTDLLRDGVFPAGTGVVVMTGEGDVKRAVDAMRLGAADYLTKPFEVAELPLVFARVRRDRQARRVEEHRREDQAPRDDEFVFGSALASMRAQLDRILAADVRMQTHLAPVLIHGETGTGKTTIARWLHAHGPRADRAMVEVNCSALPETLAETELFGHERGAFTDARTARMGLFEAANGGTLFLDELASLSLPLQAKVLTAIEDRHIRRVGGNRSIVVDVRVIAASNRDLRAAVKAGEFREDLLHRLDLFRLGIPPLRERRADIVPLARALMLRACRRHRLAPRDLSEGGCRRLEAYAWPGNVRELAHELERALVFEDGPLTFAHLHLSIPEEAGPGQSSASGAEHAEGMPRESGEWLNPEYQFPESGFSLDGAVDRLVRRAVDQSKGNVSAAARLLGVTRDVVRYRLEGRANLRVGDKSPRHHG